MAIMQLSNTPQLLRNATRASLQPAARRSAVPLRSRMIVRAEEQATEESASPPPPSSPLPPRSPLPPPPQQKGTKSSWELIEEPVRGGNAPDGGKPVSQRNNEFDNLLINYDGADERSLTGLPVSFPDAFRFKGAAPEVINCRLAMLGAFAGLTAELASGKSIVEQYRIAPLPIAGVFLLFAIASLIPIAKGVPRKGAAEFGSPLTFLTPTLEVNVGRVAMLGIAGTILTEAIIGHAVL